MAEAEAPPLEYPLQLALESTIAAATITAGSVIVTDALSEHPLLSVITTLYVPATTPVIEAVVAPLLHKYVYGIVPPVAEAEAPPLEYPLQLVLESTIAAATIAVGSVIVTDALSVHPLLSVT